jgi:hypothetical protein
LPLPIATDVIAKAILFSGRSAIRTTPGFVLEAFACEELLLTSVKGKS